MTFGSTQAGGWHCLKNKTHKWKTNQTQPLNKQKRKQLGKADDTGQKARSKKPGPNRKMWWSVVAASQPASRASARAEHRGKWKQRLDRGERGRPTVPCRHASHGVWTWMQKLGLPDSCPQLQGNLGTLTSERRPASMRTESNPQTPRICVESYAGAGHCRNKP